MEGRLGGGERRRRGGHAGSQLGRVEVVDHPRRAREVVACRVRVRERHARDVGGDRGAHAAHVVLDRDRVRRVLAQLPQRELVRGRVRLGLVDLGGVDDHVEVGAVDVRAERVEQRCDVLRSGRRHQADLHPGGAGLLDGVDDAGTRGGRAREALAEERGLRGVDGLRVDRLPAGLGVLGDA